jgi:membrane protein
MRLSASVAMYSILSLSPLLVITIKMAAVVLSEDTAKREVHQQVEELLGPKGAATVDGMITAAAKPSSGLIATAISGLILLYSASGVFTELRDSLNALWGVNPPSGAGWWAFIREQFLAIGMVFAVGFLLLGSQVLTTTLIALSQRFGAGFAWVSVSIDFVVSTAVITLLFAALFRFLPDIRLAWRYVLPGAAVTALLFKLGQFLLALYFTYISTGSVYGAAGSFVIVMLWIYYSCWILFYGAELIRVYAHRHAQPISH